MIDPSDATEPHVESGDDLPVTMSDDERGTFGDSGTGCDVGDRLRTAGEVGWLVRQAYAEAVADYMADTAEYSPFPGLREEVSNFVRSAPAGRVLDLGCGSGRDAQLAAALGRPVVVLDAAYEMVSAAAARSGLRAVCGDSLALPFVSQSFAAVIASGVLLHLPKAVTSIALVELRRVLIEGGTASVSMKSGSHEGWRSTGVVRGRRWFAYFTVREFADLCYRVGLSTVALSSGRRDDWFTLTVTR